MINQNYELLSFLRYVIKMQTPSIIHACSSVPTKYVELSLSGYTETKKECTIKSRADLRFTSSPISELEAMTNSIERDINPFIASAELKITLSDFTSDIQYYESCKNPVFSMHTCYDALQIGLLDPNDLSIINESTYDYFCNAAEASDLISPMSNQGYCSRNLTTLKNLYARALVLEDADLLSYIEINEHKDYPSASQLDPIELSIRKSSNYSKLITLTKRELGPIINKVYGNIQ